MYHSSSHELYPVRSATKLTLSLSFACKARNIDFNAWFNNSLQHALDAGMTVDQLLAALGATSLQDLANLSLPGFQSADKNGDGLICQKFTPSVINIGIPYASSFRDNIDATQS